MSEHPSSQQAFSTWLTKLEETRPSVARLFQDISNHPTLQPVLPDLRDAYEAISQALAAQGTLFLCGNGGSFSDALHISGELLKSFELPRPIKTDLAQRLRQLPDGQELAQHLQSGLRAHVLGCNPALSSAVGNDIPLPGIGFAQELAALARPGDVFLGLSTSGHSRNVLLAATTAKALGLATISLTGAADNPLSERSDIALKVSATRTYRVQELHLALYHQLCLILEAHFFDLQP